MSTPAPTDRTLRDILRRTRSIALVGVSPNPIRPSHYVGRYLWRRGYRVFPVNPKLEGATLFGEPAVDDLGGLAARGVEVDMLDIFRRSEEAGAVVDAAIAALSDRGLRTIWMQIGVIDEAAAERARSRGLEVVMDRCPKMEHQRLFGELSRAGVNTGIISSRRP